MDFITWSDKISTGNFMIDKQHMMFVELINTIYDEYNGIEEKKYLDLHLKELLLYATFHFCSEENIMLKAGYPGCEGHKEEHRKLIAELRNSLASVNHEYVDFESLFKFLSEWFMVHTQTEDRKLSQYLR